MIWLVVGLVLFLGVHSLRMLWPQWYEQTRRRLGLSRWKLLYSVISVVGLICIVYGFGQARLQPVWLWIPPIWSRHLAALLILIAFIYLAVAKMPYSKMKAMGGHPMVIGVKLWAFAHLLSNGTLADVILFGSFLAWAVANYAVSQRRDRLAGVTYSAPSWKYDIIAIIVGTLFYGVFVAVLHRWLIGVAPFG